MKWLERLPFIGAFVATAVSATGTSTLGTAIEVGMLILVYNGVLRVVIKLVYKVLWGRELQITKGLLDYLSDCTRPMKATALVENSGELENEDAIVETVSRALTGKIKMAKMPRTNKMKEKIKGTFAYLKANPKTFLGIFAVILFLVDLGLEAFFNIHAMDEVIDLVNDVVPLPASLESAFSGLLILGLGYFGINGVKGQGFETVDQRATRIENEKEQAKIAEAAAKLDRSAQTVVKRAEELGADPVVYAMNNGVGQGVIDKIKAMKQ